MRIGAIIGSSQPGLQNQLKKRNKDNNQSNKKHKDKDLSFNDIEQMMKHDSYMRGKGGALRQVKHSE